MMYTEPAPRRQHFHVAPAMQQPNSAVSALLLRIFKKESQWRLDGVVDRVSTASLSNRI